MLALKLQIGLALLALSCGPILYWRRRDNILGYGQAGLFLGTIAVPLLTSRVFEQAGARFVELYAVILCVGAAAFMGGTALGASIGSRSPRKIPLTFTRQLGAGSVLRFVERRARILAAVGVAAFALAYLLMGYVPLLAADRQAAKYGTGAYRSSFNRGSMAYLFALALGSALLPVMMALYRTRRRSVDLVLALALGLALLGSLSRVLAFSGPLVFATALAIERRVRPTVILACVTFVYLGGAVFNGLLFPATGAGPSLGDQIAVSAPDLSDGVGFLEGFVLQGSEQTAGRTILGGLRPGPGEWDPRVYSLRVRTGIDDVDEFPSGGIRLPAPVWGYASFGLPGVIGFSALSGMFIGWGVGKWRRLMAPVSSGPNAALNLTIASAVYQGTFGLAGSFYFLSTGELLTLTVALLLGVFVTFRVLGGGTRPTISTVDRVDRPAGRPVSLHPGLAG